MTGEDEQDDRHDRDDQDEQDDQDDQDEQDEQDEEDPGWPWSFILLVVAGALYLIFRFVELGITLLR